MMGRVQTGGEYTGKPVGPQTVRKIFVPESRLPSLYKSVPFSKKRPRRPEPGFKDGFEEMEHEFQIWFSGIYEYSVRKNRTTFSDVFLFPEIFR